MPTKPPVFRPAGWKPRPQAERERKRALDQRRGSARQRGYDRDWEQVRLQVLADEPLCRFCVEAGRVTAATVVDHIQTIAERPDLRLERSNLRGLCAPCHNARTARDQGFARPRR